MLRHNNSNSKICLQSLIFVFISNIIVSKAFVILLVIVMYYENMQMYHYLELSISIELLLVKQAIADKYKVVLVKLKNIILLVIRYYLAFLFIFD